MIYIQYYMPLFLSTTFLFSKYSSIWKAAPSLCNPRMSFWKAVEMLPMSARAIRVTFSQTCESKKTKNTQPIRIHIITHRLVRRLQEPNNAFFVQDHISIMLQRVKVTRLLW